MIEAYFEFGLAMPAPMPIDNDVRWGRFIIKKDGMVIFCWYQEDVVADSVLEQKIIKQLKEINPILTEYLNKKTTP